MSTHKQCFEQKYEKYQNLYLKTFSFYSEMFNTFKSACFRNGAYTNTAVQAHPTCTFCLIRLALFVVMIVYNI